jgi:uncharacterized protein
LALTKIGLGIFAALLIGAASTLFGIGGGPLLVPLLVYFFELNDSVARGTSLALVIVNGILGLFSRRISNMDLVQYFDLGTFLLISIPLSIGSLFAIPVISYIVGFNVEMDPIMQSTLRKYFGLLIILLGLIIIWYEQVKK